MNIKAIVYILTALTGLCVGSFLNVVIYRVPNAVSVAFPPSHCPKCAKNIKWYDNIPILSYILLRGKCRNCGCRISLRYPAVETVNCLLWLLCVFMLWDANIVYCIISMAVCSVMICIFIIDIDHCLIFYRFQIALALLAAAGMFTGQGAGVIDRLIGLAAGLVLFALIYLVFLFLIKREGIGIGDIILMATSGLLVGWQGIILVMFVSSVTASIVLLTVRCLNKENDRFHEYPFAPFIVFGDLIALFFGGQIIDFYMRFVIGG